MRDILENFPTENVELYDNNSKIKDLKGLFGKSGLTITDTSTPILEGQMIIRTLPNCSTEKYIIVESKYNLGHNGICDFYKLTLQKDNISSNMNTNIYIDNSISIGDNNNNNNIEKNNIESNK